MRVWPTSDIVRKHVRHPSAGGFTGNDGAGDWPHDQFTARRLVEGDITTEQPASPTSEPRQKATMTISFKKFPANWRQPLFWLEIDPSQAGGGTFNLVALLVGQMFTSGGAAGSAVPNVPVALSSVAQAQALFGVGSMLERMVNAFLRCNSVQTLYALPLADPSGGVAATGSITVASAPTAAGTIDLYIAGQVIDVGVGATDLVATVATNIAAAINALTTLPVSATAAMGVVSLTCKWKGSTGNDITLMDSYYGLVGGEVLPAGLTLTYAAMSGGTGAPSLTTAIANLGESGFEYVAMPYTDSTSWTTWDAEYGFSQSGRWGWMRQLYGEIFTCERGTPTALMTLSETQNSGVISPMAIEPLMPSPVWEVTAGYCAMGARALSDDPGRPLQTLVIAGLLPAQAHNRFLTTDRNTLSNFGLATQAATVDNKVMIMRETMSYQFNLYGQPDQAYGLMTTLSTLSSLFRSMKQAITSKYPRSKLANDGTNFGAGQAIVTPSIVKAEIVNEYAISEFNGLVQDTQDFKNTLIVERDSNDPNRLNVLFPPNVINQLRIFAVLAQFRLMYDLGMPTGSVVVNSSSTA